MALLTFNSWELNGLLMTKHEQATVFFFYALCIQDSCAVENIWEKEKIQMSNIHIFKIVMVLK